MNKDTETVNLHSVKWDPQEKDKNRIFLATENHLSFYLKRSERKPLNRNSIHPASLSAKAFADDRPSLEDHQSLLLTINDKCSDLDSTFKPEKCVSIVFNGSTMDHTTTFSSRNGSTHNIADTPTKLLGRLIAVSTSTTKNAATSELENKFYLP